ncbi:MAG TPA: DUF5674 family protein [Anaerolineales bacterium]|nr:DUF5674 family protein [Anaerolineales bacterium]
MPIHLLRERATPQQVQEMLARYEKMIKDVVDIRQKTLAGGGEMHADCEAILLEDGSEQDDLWGANWWPKDQRVEFESLINIRPRLNNRSVILQSEELRQPVEAITRQLLGDVR